MNKSDRNSFVFYRSFYEAISELTPKQKGNLFDAICEYALNQNDIELSGVEKCVFTLIKPQLDANYKKYINGCLGGKHGKKGGRPPKQETPKKPLKNPKETPNDNVNVNENDNEYFNEKELSQFRKNCPSLSHQEFKEQYEEFKVWINCHGSKTPELTFIRWLKNAEKDSNKKNVNTTQMQEDAAIMEEILNGR